MYIKRNYYLNQLISSLGNGLVKIVTGPRRSGKSFLVFHLFKDYLLNQGVSDDHIIELSLDSAKNIEYRNPLSLAAYFDERHHSDGKTYYFLIDEIQFVKNCQNPFLKDQEVTFYDSLNQFLGYHDTEIIITGSNSNRLSKDIATEFRGRGWQIRMHPLSFSEFKEGRTTLGLDDFGLWNLYRLYGGLPAITNIPDTPSKRKYLEEVFNVTYRKDIIDRYGLRSDTSISDITKIRASSVGSFVNPQKISDAFLSKEKTSISCPTVKRFLSYREDSFLLSKAERYDIKGRRFIQANYKYYFEDRGLRNAAVLFAGEDQEPHFMENIVYNELIRRGYHVYVGIVSGIESGKKKDYEVNFVADKGGEKVYIQSALLIPDKEKRNQEKRPLRKIKDSFKKIIITKYSGDGLYDEDGILHLNLFDFLEHPNKIA